MWIKEQLGHLASSRIDSIVFRLTEDVPVNLGHALTILQKWVDDDPGYNRRKKIILEQALYQTEMTEEWLKKKLKECVQQKKRLEKELRSFP